MIWPIAIGLMLGAGIHGIARQLWQMRRPGLAARLSQNLPGFRVKRGAESFGLTLFWAQVRQAYSRYFANSSLTKRRQREVIFELPDYLDFLSVALSAGVTFQEALVNVNQRTAGVLHEEFRLTTAALDMGSTLEAEMQALANRLPHRQVEEFCNKVVMSQRRGTPLALSLRDQSTAIRLEIKNLLLSQAGKNETRMLIPLVFLILPVTILFAVYPSLQLLNLNYF